MTNSERDRLASELDEYLSEVKMRLEKAESRYICDDFSGELSEKYAERGMRELVRYAPTDLQRLLDIVAELRAPMQKPSPKGTQMTNSERDRLGCMQQKYYDMGFSARDAEVTELRASRDNAHKAMNDAHESLKKCGEHWKMYEAERARTAKLVEALRYIKDKRDDRCWISGKCVCVFDTAHFALQEYEAGKRE